MSSDKRSWQKGETVVYLYYRGLITQHLPRIDSHFWPVPGKTCSHRITAPQRALHACWRIHTAMANKKFTTSWTLFRLEVLTFRTKNSSICQSLVELSNERSSNVMHGMFLCITKPDAQPAVWDNTHGKKSLLSTFDEFKGPFPFSACNPIPSGGDSCNRLGWNV